MNTITLNLRQKKLAEHLQENPAGLKAADLLKLQPYQSGEFDKSRVRKLLLRDLKRLHELELSNYEEGKGKGTVWRPGKRQTVEFMSVEHAVAISALSLFGDLPLDQEMSGKVSALMSDADLRLKNEKKEKHYARLKEKIAFKPWVDARERPRVRPEIFETLLDATLKEQNIHFSYLTSEGRSLTKKGVSPLALLAYRDILYLAFYEGGENEPMVWPLHRFDWVEVVQPSEYRTPESWSLAGFMRQWDTVPCDYGSKPETVKLRFLNKVSVRNLRDAPFRDCSQSVVEDPERPGTFLFTAELKPNRELLTWILYFGQNVEVLEPPILRQKLREEVEAMAALYRA